MGGVLVQACLPTHSLTSASCCCCSWKLMYKPFETSSLVNSSVSDSQSPTPPVGVEQGLDGRTPVHKRVCPCAAVLPCPALFHQCRLLDEVDWQCLLACCWLSSALWWCSTDHKWCGGVLAAGHLHRRWSCYFVPETPPACRRRAEQLLTDPQAIADGKVWLEQHIPSMYNTWMGEPSE